MKPLWWGKLEPRYRSFFFSNFPHSCFVLYTKEKLWFYLFLTFTFLGMDQRLLWFHQTSLLLVLQDYPGSNRHLSLYFFCSYLADFAVCTNYHAWANITQTCICLFAVTYHFYAYLSYKMYIGSVMVLRKEVCILLLILMSLLLILRQAYINHILFSLLLFCRWEILAISGLTRWTFLDMQAYLSHKREKLYKHRVLRDF